LYSIEERLYTICGEKSRENREEEGNRKKETGNRNC
jgi:hypothetical protein